VDALLTLPLPIRPFLRALQLAQLTTHEQEVTERCKAEFAASIAAAGEELKKVRAYSRHTFKNVTST